MLAVASRGLRALDAARSAGFELVFACKLPGARSLADAAGQPQSSQRPRSTDPQVRAAAAANAPATIPELPSRPTVRDALCLSSINDPDNYGLGVSPQGSGEPEYYWQGSSLGNPKEAVSLCGTRGGAPSPLSRQGFRTAQTRPMLQRVIFRSSMLDPDHPALAEEQPKRVRK